MTIAKPLYSLWPLCLLLLLHSIASAEAEVEIVDSQVLGLAGRELRNGMISATVVPAYGGRVLSFRLGDHEFMWYPDQLDEERLIVREDSLNQYELIGGGFTWVAPQERWTVTGRVWPPPPTQMLGDWEVEELPQGEDGRRGLLAVGPLELRPHWNAGRIRLSRELHMIPDSARLIVEHRMRNDSEQHQSWALWSNMQLRAMAAEPPLYERYCVYFPVRRQGQYAPLGWMWYGTPGSATAQAQSLGEEEVALVRYMRRGGKLGADSDGGWIAFQDAQQGLVFARRFQVNLRRRYAENRNTIAVYTSVREPFIEKEVMGPLEELPPGAEASFVEEWVSCRAFGPVLAVVDAGVINRRLQASAWGQAGLVDGAYGVFDRGTAILRRHDEDGDSKELWRGPVSPLEALQLNQAHDLREAVELSLVIVDARGQERELDRSPVAARARRAP